MKPERFRATLDLRTKSATTVSVPEEVIEALGAGKRPRVRATLGGHTYSATIGIMKGDFLLPVSAEVRDAAGIEAGQELEVEMEVDTTTREIVVPLDLAAALAADREAERAFAALSAGKRRRLIEQVEAAKSAATRERRIRKAVESALTEGGGGR